MAHYMRALAGFSEAAFAAYSAFFRIMGHPARRKPQLGIVGASHSVAISFLYGEVDTAH